MGARTFCYEAKGTEKDGSRLFRALSEENAREYGDDPYTGDIGQKGSFSQVNTKPLLPGEVQDFIERNQNRCEKWDNTALAATVAAVTGKPRQRTISIKAKSEAEAREKAIARVQRDTKRPQQIRVLGVIGSGSPNSGKITRKKHTSAKPKIKWTFQRHHRGNLFDTALDAAKAAEVYLKEHLNDQYGYTTDKPIGVYPVAVLESDTRASADVNGTVGAAYSVSIAKNDKATTFAVTLEMCVVNPDKVGGWVFFGWAAE